MKTYVKVLPVMFAAMLYSFTGDQSGEYVGRVVNGSFNDAPVSGMPVVLQGYRQGQDDAALVFETLTDPRGWFVFTGLKQVEQLAYYPKVTYKNVQYSGALLPAGSDSTAVVRIFEVTESDSVVMAAMNHVLFEPARGGVQVREVYQLGNRSLFTFVGSTEPGQAGISLVFPLPEGAGAVSVGGDLMSCCTIIKDGKVSDTMEFKPGSKQAVVNYELPSEGSEVVFTRQVMIDTELLDFYLPQPLSVVSVRVQSPDGEAREMPAEPEPFEIRGRSFQRFALDRVTEGSVVTVVLAGVPAPPADLRLFAAVLVVLLLALTFLAVRRFRPVPAVADPDTLQTRRTQLIQQVLQLDDRHEKGELSKEKYMLFREQLLQKIEEIDRRLNH